MKYLVKKSVLLLLVVLAFCACDNSNDNGEVIQPNPQLSKTVDNYTGKVEFVVWNDKKQGVFLHTTALVLPEDKLEEAYEAFAAKHGNFRPKSEDLEVYISPIGTIDENSTTQNVWHFVA